MGTLQYIQQRDMDTLALQGFLCLLNVTQIYKTRYDIKQTTIEKNEELNIFSYRKNEFN